MPSSARAAIIDEFPRDYLENHCAAESTNSCSESITSPIGRQSLTNRHLLKHRYSIEPHDARQDV